MVQVDCLTREIVQREQWSISNPPLRVLSEEERRRYFYTSVDRFMEVADASYMMTNCVKRDMFPVCTILSGNHNEIPFLWIIRWQGVLLDSNNLPKRVFAPQHQALLRWTIDLSVYPQWGKWVLDKG